MVPFPPTTSRIDRTFGRQQTFFDGPDVVHVDFTEPYCGELRSLLRRAAREAGIELRPNGTYICTNGPRLESRAEIQAFRQMEADVVGMTGMPETVLARELELCFTGIAVVTNPAAGLNGRKLTTTEVVETMNSASERLKTLLGKAFPLLAARTRSCFCTRALEEAGF